MRRCFVFERTGVDVFWANWGVILPAVVVDQILFVERLLFIKNRKV